MKPCFVRKKKWRLKFQDSELENLWSTNKTEHVFRGPLEAIRERMTYGKRVVLLSLQLFNMWNMGD